MIDNIDVNWIFFEIEIFLPNFISLQRGFGSKKTAVYMVDQKKKILSHFCSFFCTIASHSRNLCEV